MRSMLPIPALAILAFSAASLTAPSALAQAVPGAPAATPAATPTATPATEDNLPATSIAVIDFQAAVLATAEFDKAYNDLQTKYQPMQNHIQELQQDLSDVQTQLRAAAGQLSSSGQAELEARGARLQRELDRATSDADEEFSADRDEALRLVSTRMQEVLAKLAGEHGWDAVVEINVVPFFKGSLDITQTAIDAYNATYPVN